MKLRRNAVLYLVPLLVAASVLFMSDLSAAFAQQIQVDNNGQVFRNEPVTVGAGDLQISGLPEDWTHHHLVFSDPGTEQEALDRGTYDQWFMVVNDPRYILQQLKRGAPARGPASEEVAGIEQAQQSASMKAAAAHGDWSMDLGSGAKVGAGMFPAKYSFDGPPECGNTTTPDFVAFNTSLGGMSTQASVVGYYNLYSSCSGQVPSVYWAFNTGGAVVTSVVPSYTGSQLAFIQTPSIGNPQLVLLKWTATPSGRSVTATLTSGSQNFTVTTGSLSAQDVGAAIAGTGIPPGDTIATVTSSTTGTLFAAATGGGSQSLAISADAGSPHMLTSVGAAAYPTCMAPCMATISFSGATRSDAISSPFYDYSSDTLYVGDHQGSLHKFNPVFNGTATTPPAEIETSGGPWVAVSTTTLSGPVYDSTSGRVFIGDASGFVYAVSATGAVTKSVQVATGSGIIDAPVVDSSAGQVYVVVSDDTNASNSATSPCSGTPGAKTVCNGVIQLPTNFTATTDFAESVMGVNTTNVLYAGAFDNQYETNGTGNLYVNASNGSQEPKLMEIPLTTSGFSTHACQSGTGSLPNCSSLQCAINIDDPMTSAAAAPSPVTEVFNTSTNIDWIFTSVSANGTVTITPGGNTCTGACLYSYNVTTTLSSGADAANGLASSGGSSGIIIDNTSSVSGASQVYFSTLTNGTCGTSGGTGGCAVQASQAGLN